MSIRRPRDRWSQAVASFAISASWHFLVLMVLALAVHPFQLPDETPPVIVELLPPLISPPPPVELEPKPITPEPTETLRRLPPVLDKPIELRRPTPAAAPKLVQLKIPPAPAPPDAQPAAPLETARPLAPVLDKPLEVERRPAPAPRLVQTNLAPPALPEPAVEAPAAPTPSPAQVQVLTNEQVIQAPVEIRRPARAAAPALRDTVAGAPDLPVPPGAAGGGGAGASGGGAAGGGAIPLGAIPGNAGRAVNGRIVGFDDNGVRGGLRMTLGCLNPETYKLTAAERAACLARLAAQAKNAAMMGINISPAKQAEFDRQRACHAANAAGGAVPRSSEGSADTGSIAGLGANARLRDCRPTDR
jgi:hypothetical protein